MNRITAAVERMAAQIDQRVRDGLITQADVEATGRSLDMDLLEYAKFQELKSAVTGTLLSLEEAQTVYAYLGETPSVFNGQSVAIKATLTKLFAELLGRLIAARQAG